jgi:carbon monoxide dehydrogenase subunit G
VINISGSNLIMAPLEEVFSITADYKNWPNLFQDVRSVQPVREADGETVLEVVDKTDNRKFTVTQRAESPETVVREIKKKGVRSKATYKLQAVAEGTLVSFSIDMSLSGLYRILNPMAEWYLANRIAENSLLPR